MELNIPDIIAHPDIYLIGRENFGEIENKVANMICKSAEKYNIPIEINMAQIFNKTYRENGILNDDPLEMQKKRLSKVPYPRREFWEVASKYNVKVLYGLDVHHRTQILHWNELRELANEIVGEETIKKLSFIEE